MAVQLRLLQTAVVLSPADVATYTLRYTVDQDDMNSGRLSNMASVVQIAQMVQQTAQTIKST